MSLSLCFDNNSQPSARFTNQPTIAEYHFDDFNSKIVKDYSGRKNNAILGNTPPSYSSQGLLFASGQWLEAPVAIAGGTSAVSILVVWCSTTLTTGMRLFKTNGSGVCSLYCYSNNSIGYELPGNAVAQADNQIYLNTWTCAVAVFRPGLSVDIYVNGTLKVSTSIAFTNFNPGTLCYIGKEETGNSNQFVGQMATLISYPLALSSNQVAVETNLIMSRLKKRGIALGAAALHPDTELLNSRIITNSGTIQQSDLQAIDVFVRSCYSKNLRSSIACAGLFAGDNLQSALTTLWTTNAIYLSNSGFTSGNYSRATGLTGNTASYLDTGVLANSLSIASAGVAIYNRTNSSGDMAEIGTLDASQNGVALYSKRSDNLLYNAVFNDTSSALSVSNPAILGSVISVVENGTAKLFINGVEIGSKSSLTGSLPSTSIYVFGLNKTSNKYLSSRSLGCFFIHSLTFNQSIILSGLIQTLMTAFGRNV